MKPEAILFVWDRIGDYHHARIRACEELLDMPVYTADLAGTDALYKWDSIKNTSHAILSHKSAEQSDVWARFKNFRKVIKANNIRVVAMPYGRTEYLFFLLYAQLHGIRTIIFCESWYTRGKVKDYFKSILLKITGDSFFVSGERAYKHLTENYSISPKKVVTGYSVVDNKHFSDTTLQKQTLEKEYMICVARYSEEKNLEVLIRCYAKSTICNTYKLLLVGDGPQRTKLQQLINELHVKEQVVLSGWTTYEKLPDLYAASVACVLPSTFEPWGLAVNEAMAAGLPVLISDACGCKPDLIKEGENGWTFERADEKEIIALLNRIAALNSNNMQKMGALSKQIIAQFTPCSWAENIKKMIYGLQ